MLWAIYVHVLCNLHWNTDIKHVGGKFQLKNTQWNLQNELIFNLLAAGKVEISLVDKWIRHFIDFFLVFFQDENQNARLFAEVFRDSVKCQIKCWQTIWKWEKMPWSCPQTLSHSISCLVFDNLNIKTQPLFFNNFFLWIEYLWRIF